MEGFKVEMNTDVDQNIILNFGDKVLKIPHSIDGLYYCMLEGI